MTATQKKITIALGIGALLLLLRFTPLDDAIQRGVAAAREAGPWGIVAFTVVYAVVTVTLIPASLLTLAAGATWGPLGGLMAVWPGATLGAVLSFLLARSVLRETVAERVRARPGLAALDEALGDEGGWVVFLLRLSPLFPFGLLNYALGLTRVRLGAYALSTAIGILPGTLLYAWLGATAGELGGAATGSRTLDGRTVMLGVGLVATGIATFVVTRAARRALQRRLPASTEAA